MCVLCVYAPTSVQYLTQQSPYSSQFRNGTTDDEARLGDGFQAQRKSLYVLLHTISSLH
jgi:hypothetical protein